MQDASIPPKDNTYIVGYAGQIPLMKELCGNTLMGVNSQIKR